MNLRNLSRQGIVGAAVVPFAVPKSPQFSDPRDTQNFGNWASGLSVMLSNALQALRLDRSGNQSAPGVLPGASFSFVGRDYLVNGYKDFGIAVPTPFHIACCFRSKTATGATDPLRPDRAFTLQRPVALGDSVVRVILAVAPAPLEEFQMAFLSLQVS